MAGKICGDGPLKFSAISNQYFWNFQLLFAEGRLKRFDDVGIEIGAHALNDGVASLEGRHTLAVRAIADHGVVRVRDGDDPGFNGNFLALRRVVARSVEF